MSFPLTNPDFLDHLTNILGERVIHHQSQSGGDIANAIIVETTSQSWFVKVVNDADGLSMLQAEKGGLDAIAASGAIKAPIVQHCGAFGTSAILIMEFVERKSPGMKDFERLGRQLAQMHQKTNMQFGWARDNFIGRLPQYNGWSLSWPTFYLGKRLILQLIMARNANLLSASGIPDESRMAKVLDELFLDIAPSLLHGDLWSGNYLIATNGDPYLIDPSVYYGHSEIDLAMSRLFGGFGDAFYASYAESIPTEPGAKERSDIYQLYYLLVHLNMFGPSYAPAVNRILRKYFG